MTYVLKLEKFWKHLPYEDIVNLCQVNKEFNMISQDNTTWIYLLQRDYNVTYIQDNTRDLYLKYRRIINNVTRKYTVVTQHTIKIICNYVPPNLWKILTQKINKRYKFTQSPILCIEDLQNIDEPSISDYNQYFETVYPDLNQLNRQIYNQNCDIYLKTVTKPTLIYINKKPVIIKYDYDLANLLQQEDTFGDICGDHFNAIQDYIENYIIRIPNP